LEGLQSGPALILEKLSSIGET